MFDFVRKHTRLALGLLLLLIIPSFVFFGVENYTSFMDDANQTVASVDGDSIKRAEWVAAHQRSVEQRRRQSPNVPASVFDTPEFRRETLEQLIRQRTLLAAARTLNLAPSDARLQRLFAADPQFASIRNPDGSVNRELLQEQGMNSEQFTQQLRQDVAMRQVLVGVEGTAIAPALAASAAVSALLQRREVQIQRFEPGAYRAKVVPSDTEIAAFYDANAALFRAEEQATIEYVLLDLQTVGRGIEVPEEELRKYYAENASRYTVAEERRASHILLKADAASPAADQQKAKARAEALLVDLRKNPAAFGDLARANSQDEGSAVRGGDLEFFGRGQMVKPFEDAAFAMKQGEISNVIQSDFGFHIITLTGVRGGTTKPFDEVRPEITAEVRKALAARRYAEAAEQFTNLVYEQADSLQPVVDKLKLQKATATVRRVPAPGDTGPLASLKLLQAVFADDAVRNKRNTDAVEVGPSQLVSARVLAHQPARTLPLADVRAAVRDRLVEQQAAALARQDGMARLQQLRAAGAPADALPETLSLSRAQAQTVPRPLLEAALQADASRLPAVVGVDLGPEGYAVMRVVKLLPREQVPGGDAPLREQYGRAFAAAETEAYLVALKKRYKADFKASANEPAASAATR